MGFFGGHIITNSPICLFPGWLERLPDSPASDDRRTTGAHLQPITHTCHLFYKPRPHLILRQFVVNSPWYSLAPKSFILLRFMIPVSCANLIISPTDRPSQTPIYHPSRFCTIVFLLPPAPLGFCLKNFDC